MNTIRKSVSTPLSVEPFPKTVYHQVNDGPPVSPEQRLSLYSDKQFEDFIKDWVLTGEISKKYLVERVDRLGGSGDKGRDVVARVDSTPGSTWDNYQCKHYKDPLTPSDIWVELGKLCYYTFKNTYTVPRKYYFVSPKGIGSDLYDLLQNPYELRRKLVDEAWEKNCAAKITKSVLIPLEGELKEYVEKFNFSIVDYLPPHEIIRHYKTSPNYFLRFGRLQLPLPSPADLEPPKSIAANETRYVEQILEAYSDYKGKRISQEDILGIPLLKRHFDKSRVEFYTAEALLKSARDASIDGCDYQEAKTEIYRAIEDTIDDDHEHGFARLKAATKVAQETALEAHVLTRYLMPTHKRGMCHQLANEDAIKWVPI